jgi:hypothetical protein
LNLPAIADFLREIGKMAKGCHQGDRKAHKGEGAGRWSFPSRFLVLLNFMCGVEGIQREELLRQYCARLEAESDIERPSIKGRGKPPQGDP